MKSELDNFVVYVQRYIETQLHWMTRVSKFTYKTLEEKLETIEWSLRNTEFISSEEHQKFLISFRDLYASAN